MNYSFGFVTKVTNLLNGSSKALNVNGSVTPQVFTYTATGVVAVLGMTCLLKQDGNTALDKFGSLSSLTNGLIIDTTISSVSTTITNIKDNADLCTRFHFNQFGNGAVLSLLGISTAQGFGNSNNVFMGHMELKQPLVMQSPDTITATVRDNLSSIDFLQISVHATSM